LRNKANLERLLAARTADISAPTILQFDVPLSVAGGKDITLPVLAIDDRGPLLQYTLQYSEDGLKFSTVAEALPEATSITWSVPKVDIQKVSLKLIATDLANNSTSKTSDPFDIDSTPPLSPQATLASSTNTADPVVKFSLNICRDTSKVLVQESTIAYQAQDLPLTTDSAWQNCSTDPSAISQTLTTDGTHFLRLWAMDAAQNISLQPSSTFTVLLDQTPPVLTFSTSPLAGALLVGGNSFSLAFSASDVLSGMSSLKLQYAVNGVTFSDVATLTVTDIAYSWTIPTDDSSQAKLRLVATDQFGNSNTLDSPAFIIDSSNPVVSLTSPTGAYRGGSSLDLSFSASDAGSGVASLALQYASDGTTFTGVTSLTPGSTSYSWTVPTHDVVTAKLRMIATDSLGHTSTTTTNAFTVDSTGPSIPSISLASGSPTNSTAVTFTVASCTDRVKVFASEGTTTPLYDDAGWINCSTSAGAIPFTLSTGDATKTVHFWAQDAVGNVSTTYVSVPVILDTTPPTISLTSLSGGQFIPGGQNYNITWTAADANFGAGAIKLEYSSDSGSTWNIITGGTSNTGSYAWAVPSSTNSTTFRVRATATDLVSYTASVASTSDFTVDSDAPTISAFSITEGANTVSNNIRINLTASDPFTKVTRFCLKYNDPALPTLTDTCWSPVNNPSPGITPALNISFSNFYFLIGFTTGNYTIYGWVRDQAGNISPLSASGVGTDGTDKATINYTPGTPPVVSDALATSVDNPSNPPTSNDMATPSGSTVYIKWKATDDQPLPSTPISLYYTLDNITYTLIASNISNSANAGCTISGAQTGCYTWTNGSPTDGYLSIRVAAQDSNSMVSYTTAPALNVMPPIRFLAGNTEPGLNGSASAAMFFNAISDGKTDAGSLLVHPNGTIYFRDIMRGILVVSPSDGIQKLLIPTTGTASGDGGPISSATLKMPIKIALDFQNRILVFDYNRIRRIDTNVSPMTIDTIIGGGASTAETAAPLSLSLTDATVYPGYPSGEHYIPLIPLPNGDIYFLSENYGQGPTSGGIRIRIYKADSNQVQSIRLTGIGDSYNASQDQTKCSFQSLGLSFDPTSSTVTHMETTVMHSITSSSCPGTSSPGPMTISQFDPSTGVVMTPYIPYTIMNYVAIRVTGKDGGLYSVSRKSPWIAKFNGTNWVALVGTGTLGSCPDGTAALSCKIDPQDLYVTAQGKLYFMDKGRIRTLNDSGQVITLLGQPYSYGDGGPALSARFNTINFFEQKNTGEITLLDQFEFRFREFTIGGNIQTIAGNGNIGTPNTSTAANAQSIYMSYAQDSFTMNPTTGDLFFYLSGNRIGKLNRATGLWGYLVGGGATLFPSANALPGSSIKLNTVSAVAEPIALGFDGTSILASVADRDVSGTMTESMFKTYTITDGTQAHLAGIAGSVGTFCANGTPTASCRLPAKSVASGVSVYDSATYDSVGNRWLFHMAGGTRVIKMDIGGNVGTLVTLPSTILNFAYHRTGGTPAEYVYYCSSDDGKLHKNDLTTDTPLAWPISSVQCTGKRLIYNSSTNSLIFIYQQNGLQGIAEYLNP
jgi:hypothetical protein